MKAQFKMREVAVPRKFRLLVKGETVKYGDFSFFKRGEGESSAPVWHKLTNEPIVNTKLDKGPNKANQWFWIIRKIE